MLNSFPFFPAFTLRPALPLCAPFSAIRTLCGSRVSALPLGCSRWEAAVEDPGEETEAGGVSFPSFLSAPGRRPPPAAGRSSDGGSLRRRRPQAWDPQPASASSGLGRIAPCSHGWPQGVTFSGAFLVTLLASLKPSLCAALRVHLLYVRW